MAQAAKAPAEPKPSEETAGNGQDRDDLGDIIGISQWEFVDRIPTGDDVVRLLKDLPDVWDVKYLDFADYVQGLPSTKKIKKRVPAPEGGQSRQVDEYHDVVTLYMGVAGRLKMLQTAQEKHGWRVDMEPEPVTPTGIPGFLQNDERIVYREYVTIWTPPRSTARPTALEPEWSVLGRKPGMAWVPASGGQQAKGSNPYEKVETAARGRAIAAWGFGVLPGSGVASLEEMLGSRENRMAIREREGQQEARQSRKTRGDLTTDVLTLSERIRQERGQTEEEMRFKMADYAQKAFGVNIVSASDEGGQVTQVDLAKLRDGQLQLMANALDESLKKILAESQAI